MRRKWTGFRLFKPARYEPVVDAVPADAVIDPFDPTAPERRRFARWGSDDKQRIPVIRAKKGKHAGADLAVLPTATWYAELKDGREKIRRVPLFTDRRASATAAELLVAAVADVQVSGRLTDADLIKRVAMLPERVRVKLVTWGILEPERVAGGRTIAAHLADWHAALLNRGTSRLQCDLVRGRVERLLASCRAQRLADLTVDRVLQAVADLRGEKGLSDRTSGFYIASILQFVRWCVRDRRLGENVLIGLDRPQVTDERERDTLAPDEQNRLIAAAQHGPVRRGMEGRDRAMLYRAGLGSGFRLGELRALMVASLGADGDTATLSLPAAATKNGVAAVQPIPDDLAAALREHVGLKLPQSRVFPTIPPTWNVSRMFKADLLAARDTWLAEAPTDAARAEREQSDFLSDRRHNGKILCFHSLRHSYVGNLKRGNVGLMSAMVLARHSDPRLTARRYGVLGLRDLAGAIKCLPSFATPAEAGLREGTTDTPVNAADPPVVLASSLAQSGGRRPTPVDSGGRSGVPSAAQKTPARLGKTANSSGKQACAPVAQLDRASVFGTEGYRFKSCRARSAPLALGTGRPSSW